MVVVVFAVMVVVLVVFVVVVAVVVVVVVVVVVSKDASVSTKLDPCESWASRWRCTAGTTGWQRRCTVLPVFRTARNRPNPRAVCAPRLACGGTARNPFANATIEFNRKEVLAGGWRVVY